MGPVSKYLGIYKERKKAAVKRVLFQLLHDALEDIDWGADEEVYTALDEALKVWEELCRETSGELQLGDLHSFLKDRVHDTHKSWMLWRGSKMERRQGPAGAS